MRLKAGQFEYPAFPEWDRVGYCIGTSAFGLVPVSNEFMDECLAVPDDKKFTAWPMYIARDKESAACRVYPTPNQDIDLILLRPMS